MTSPKLIAPAHNGLGITYLHAQRLRTKRAGSLGWMDPELAVRTLDPRPRFDSPHLRPAMPVPEAASGHRGAAGAPAEGLEWVSG
ncbi:hypothetical protein ACFW6N_32360 [Streptomyces cyaneofuscatus]|uniref:hypothetical protein n=1 Tax=Streptomyces cyaneofuscatus TaxID=66883 RepID=UPI0036CFFBB0